MSEQIYSGEDYNDKFDHEFYMEMYDDPGQQKENEFHNEWLVGLGKQGKLGGQIIMEIGTGTVLQNAAAVANFYEHIVLTDFAEKQRDWLNEWWHGKHSSTVRKLIQPIIDLEGNKQSVEDKENELKTKLMAIGPSNIMNENPLSPCVFRPVDAVVLKWTFDAVVRSEGDYLAAIHNIANLLRPGGLLIVMDLSTESYEVNNVTFRGMGMSDKTIRNIWEKSEVDLIHFQPKTVEFEGKFSYMFNILGRKK